MAIPIKGFSRYTIDETGRVYSQTSKRYLHPSPDNRGYMGVELVSDDGKSKRVLIHRLVAMAFIPNKGNLPQVNHKDENKANNNVQNLEWCTAQYNMNYGTAPARRRESTEWFYKSERIKAISRENGKAVSKRVSQFTKDGDWIATYESAKAASLATGAPHSKILEVCAGKPHRKTTGGFVWKYERSDGLLAFQY